ncbi:putative set domain protein [Phaeomoniella chlamydospora]|uniref:Putative set domain protein n=1 Tax=Phaeomoniella chlamydospora TaxID=158046 RepID=A0A0G2E7C4_PHACM|nr:putative set domain protein [Phaeomoniella chlamydospora]
METLDHHLALVDWVISNGGYCHDAVTIAHDPEKGFYPRANEPISPGASLLRCPMDCVFSVLNALDSPPFSSHGTKFPAQFLAHSPQMIQYFFLMEQKILGHESWWEPYIRTLQDDIPEYVPFEIDDLVWIEGTNLQAALKSQFARWKAIFEEGVQVLTDLKWPNVGLYTWELFVWAVKQFDSRAFTPAVLSDTLPAEKATSIGKEQPDHALLTRMYREGFSVLIPLLDLTNHRPYSKVDWRYSTTDISLNNQEALHIGEVSNNYGPKFNETLLLAYGFTIEDNPFDIVLINLKAPPESPLDEARRLWRAQGIDRDGPGKLCILNTSHPNVDSAKNRQEALFTESLLASISALVANEREMRSPLFQRELNGYTHTSRDNPLEWERNMVAIYAQLAVECKARLEILARSDPSRPNRTPANTTQRHARVYRTGQQSILECAYHLCCYELLRSQSSAKVTADQRIERRMKAYGAENVQSKVLDFIKAKAQSEVPERVMFSSGEALEYLDDTTRVGLTEALVAIEESRSVTGRLLAKIQFTVFLALADLQKGQIPTILSGRVRAWLGELDRWYPVTNTDLTLPTEELLPLLESLLNIRPEENWSQELICWAWSIVEEESVVMPTSDSGNVLDSDGSGMDLFLYFPRFD